MSDVRMDVMTVNGVEYVRRDSIQPYPNLKMANECYIVRSYGAGVFAGAIVKRDGKEVEMKNARRLWYWEGAASLSQLAVEGVSKPDKCKFPCIMPTVILTDVIEIIPMTEKSRASVERVKVWEM